MSDLVFYFGFYQPDSSNYNNPRNYTYMIEGTIPELRQLRLDVCAVYSNNQIAPGVGFKNRYTGSSQETSIPYKTEKRWKHIHVTKANAHKMPTLISWLIENNIDLNNVSETDEFTMMLIF